jgi:hypothetical protein
VAWWKLDEMSGNTAKDYASSSLDGTWYGTGTSTWHTNGKIGYAAEFDGSSDYITVGDKDIFDFGTGDFSVSGWVKTATNTGSDIEYITKRLNCNYGNFWAVNAGSQCYIRFEVDESTSGNYNQVNSLVFGSICVNQYHHFVGVRNGVNLKLYVDGVLNDSSDGSITVDLSNTHPFRIGTGPCGSITGAVDDVKIFDYALTPAQVAWDYNRGAPIAHWKFDENSSGSADGATLIDSSGNTNHGTGDDGVDNDGLSWTSGKFGYSIDFDGDDDFVDTSWAEITGSTERTFSFWIKTSSDITINLDTVLSYGTDSAGQRWTIRPNDNVSQGTVGAARTEVDSGYQIGSTVLNDNKWHHVVSVFDGANVVDVRHYIDGILEVSSDSNSQAVNTGSTVGLEIGREGACAACGNRYYNGLIDDVRIYNYALTEDMIKEVYNAGARVRFGE